MNLWSLSLLVRQFAQALNPLAHTKKVHSASFSSALDSIVYKFTNELLECWLILQPAVKVRAHLFIGSSRTRRRCICTIFHSTQPNKQLPASAAFQKRTIYETLKENTQVSQHLLAGRSCYTIGFWWWQSCECIKRDFSFFLSFFFPPTPSVWLEVCPRDYSGHLAEPSQEQTVPDDASVQHPLI